VPRRDLLIEQENYTLSRMPRVRFGNWVSVKRGLPRR
jgi:hypothetical protein